MVGFARFIPRVGSKCVLVVPPRFEQSLDEPVTSQPPPPYSAMSTKPQDVPRGQVREDQRFDDTYFDDLHSESKQRCFRDCLMHDGACTWYVVTVSSFLNSTVTVAIYRAVYTGPAWRLLRAPFVVAHSVDPRCPFVLRPS